jgi:hypothetical protein
VWLVLLELLVLLVLVLVLLVLVLVAAVMLLVVVVAAAVVLVLLFGPPPSWGSQCALESHARNAAGGKLQLPTGVSGGNAGDPCGKGALVGVGVQGSTDRLLAGAAALLGLSDWLASLVCCPVLSKLSRRPRTEPWCNSVSDTIFDFHWRNSEPKRAIDASSSPTLIAAAWAWAWAALTACACPWRCC